jgi:uncharacterized protein
MPTTGTQSATREDRTIGAAEEEPSVGRRDAAKGGGRQKSRYRASLVESCVWPAAYDVHMAEKPHGSSSVLASGELEDINRIAAARGARNVRVFGSVGRGEANNSSDLDLLVDMAEGRSLFDLVALGDELEEALGVAVDVVTEKSLSPYLRDRILAEAVSL